MVPPPRLNEVWAAYQTDLANVGFTRVTRQILSIAQADMTKPAGAVISVSPPPGTAGDPSTQTVTVTTNPDTMPVIVPDCTGKPTYAACQTTLGNAGIATSNRVTLDFNSADVTKPASIVISQDPVAGTRAWPNTDVAVTTNPDTMPVIVPDCTREPTYAACQATLGNAGIATSNRVILDFNSADLTRPASIVISQNPVAGNAHAAQHRRCRDDQPGPGEHARTRAGLRRTDGLAVLWSPQ